MEEHALAKQDSSSALVKVGSHSVQEIIEQKLYLTGFAELQKHAICLFEPSMLQTLPPLHRLEFEVITVDVGQESKDVYSVYGEEGGKGEVGIHLPKLNRICTVAGLKSETKNTVRDLNHRVVEARVWGKLPSGQEVDVTREAEWRWEDRLQFYQDAAARSKNKWVHENQEKWAEQQTLRERGKATERTGSIAIERAIRAAFGMRISFTRNELAKPILIPHAVLTPDMSDPDQKRAVIDNAFGKTSSIYPEAAALPEPEPEVPAQEEVPQEEHIEDAEFTEECAQEEQAPVPEQAPPKPRPSAEFIKLCNLTKELFPVEADMRAWLFREFEVYSRGDLQHEQVLEAVDKLVVIKNERAAADPAVQKEPETDELDAQLADCRGKLGEEKWALALKKLGKTDFTDSKPASKRAALQFLQGAVAGRIKL